MQHANKGKHINTSVPSIAVRFNANAEEIEELYQSEEESADKPNNERAKSTGTDCVCLRREWCDPGVLAGLADPESSPLRSYLPRIGKRSTSVDTSLTSQDSSPPSDPWKFFAEIKGKITKSVEDTITEIKQRNQDAEGSSKKSRLSRDKDSFSDSEEMSESSISKTCGAASTTEAVEMSSDDDTPSLEKDKKQSPEASKAKPSVPLENSAKRRFIVLRRKKSSKEVKMPIKTLGNLYELNTGLRASISDSKSAASEDNIDDVESGVDALEDANLQSPAVLTKESDTDITSIASDFKALPQASSDEEVVTNLVEQIENLEVDSSGTLNMFPISGVNIRRAYLKDDRSHTFLAPEGFVDLRTPSVDTNWFEVLYSCRYLMAVLAVLLFYFYISMPMYVSGFMAGILFTLALTGVYNRILVFNSQSGGTSDLTFKQLSTNSSQAIFEIPAVKEYQPVTKFEGWMNEYPDTYNPQTYHISQTQSVYVRLQGNLLRISHTRAKIPKRAMWNEPKHKHVFSHHRIYNLLGAKVNLLPEGLNKKRHWSKKYPICITLSKEQLSFDVESTKESLLSEDEKKVKDEDESAVKEKGIFQRKKKCAVQPQIFSKLTEEEEDFDLESGSSRPSSPSPVEEPSLDVSEENVRSNDEDEEEELLKDVFEPDEEPADEDVVSLEDWGTFTPEQDSPVETQLYLFGRTDREKEDWYRRFALATHKGATTDSIENLSIDSEFRSSVSDTLLIAARNEAEYLKYMTKFQKVAKQKALTATEEIEHEESAANVLWINALIGRVLFDCTHDENFTYKVKDRIQRKLSSLKLPYFIEQLCVSELSLGSNPPLIHRASKPVLDQRGLWVDLDITYEGSVVLTLQTKLNLMKLKQPPAVVETAPEDNSSAKWQNSDVDDTAESSTDDDSQFIPVPSKVLDEGGNPVVGLGGSSNKSKKFIKMVDKIAESKFFQAATENRYIKRAMEGVSNTDLSLKVELKGLVGTLVLNMPPPPSDRVWLGFRPTPQLWLSAQPIVGERNMSFLKQLTNWIEKKLSQEFEKILVIPNMEDIVIPVMSPKLPE